MKKEIRTAVEEILNNRTSNEQNYSYLKAVADDVKEAIQDNYNLDEWTEDRDGLEEKLNDDFWIDDSVTGNASGSYTFSRAKAAEYCTADPDTVTEALTEFCVDAETIAEKFLSQNWEYFDVTARCYVLAQAIAEVLDELEEAGAFEAEEAEEAEEATETAGALAGIAAAVGTIPGQLIRGADIAAAAITGTETTNPAEA